MILILYKIKEFNMAYIWSDFIVNFKTYKILVSNFVFYIENKKGKMNNEYTMNISNISNLGSSVEKLGYTTTVK